MKKKHRNRLISRLLAMCLAAVMMLSMGITASAALTANSTGNFTVSGFDTTDPAPTVTAYQIITVNIDAATNQPEYPMYTWAEPVATWLTNNNYSSYVDSKLGTNAVADAFANNTVSAAKMTKFLEELAAAIKANENNSFNNLTEIDGNVSGGTASFTNMAMGEYLIIASGGVTIYQPTTVKLVPKYNEDSGEWDIGTAVVGGETVGSNVKGSAPQIDKSVSKINGTEPADRTVAVGDTVTFILAVDVPAYPEDTTKKTFIISDTVGTGLAYQPGTVKVYCDSDCEKLINSNSYTTTETNASVPGQSGQTRTFAIEFNDKFFENYSAYSKVYVTYEAKVTSAAFTNDPSGVMHNDAYLGYNNDPYVSTGYTEDKDSETVYTYAINLTKVDTDRKGITTDIAKFELKNSNNETLYFTESNGVYTYDFSNTPTTSGVTKDLTTSSAGTLKIQGLDTGTYTLTETEAPDGYVLPNGTITIEIVDAAGTPSGPDGEIEEGKGGDNVKTSGGAEIYVAQGDPNAGVTISGTTISFSVVNKTAKEGLFNLPVTGGAGTVIFTMAGILLMGGAVALLVVVLRRKRS